MNEHRTCGADAQTVPHRSITLRGRKRLCKNTICIIYKNSKAPADQKAIIMLSTERKIKKLYHLPLKSLETHLKYGKEADHREATDLVTSEMIGNTLTGTKLPAISSAHMSDCCIGRLGFFNQFSMKAGAVNAQA